MAKHSNTLAHVGHCYSKPHNDVKMLQQGTLSGLPFLLHNAQDFSDQTTINPSSPSFDTSIYFVTVVLAG